jgi:hypothetical protein
VRRPSYPRPRIDDMQTVMIPMKEIMSVCRMYAYFLPGSNRRRLSMRSSRSTTTSSYCHCWRVSRPPSFFPMCKVRTALRSSSSA